MQIALFTHSTYYTHNDNYSHFVLLPVFHVSKWQFTSLAQ